MSAQPHTNLGTANVLAGLRRAGDYVPFVLLVATVVALSILLEVEDKVVLLKIVVVAYFSLLPAVLYLQFASRKTPTVWREYVLTLFRLHADDYANLPEPPETSRYYADWCKERAALVAETAGPEHEEREAQNVYRRRFEELYGPLRDEESKRARTSQSVHLERAHKLQVLVATFLITLGWVFVVQPDTIFGRSFTPGDFELRGLPAIPEESFAFAFLGAYFFILQMLVRRFFQNDLKPTAYVHATMRIIIVILIVWVLDPLLPDSMGQAERSAIAFVIGVFPTVGWQAIQAMVAVLLRRAVPSLETKDPLSDLDGMNVWYEARLVEEGIEGTQNLATSDVGNALLRTRIPPERFVDWVDQALLRLYARDSHLKGLQGYGIRTATDLLDQLAYAPAGGDGGAYTTGVESLLDTAEDREAGRPSRVRAMAVGLSGERNMQRILAWRSFAPTPEVADEEVVPGSSVAPAQNGRGEGAAPALTT
jgi:hypothetical protein